MNLGGGGKEGTKSSLTGKHRNLIFKGQSLETALAYALGKELHPPIMSKLLGIDGQAYRQT